MSGDVEFIPTPTTPDPAPPGEDVSLTVFWIWALMTIAIAVIMAQDTISRLGNPTETTRDATAELTKILALHSILWLITATFLVWLLVRRRTIGWRWQLLCGIAIALWSTGVLAWALSGADRLTVTTWACARPPGEAGIADTAFLEECHRQDLQADLTMGDSIYLWTLNGDSWWRWIAIRDDAETIQSRWPAQTSAIYLGSDDTNVPLVPGVVDESYGGRWSASFHPDQAHHLRIYYIQNGASSSAPAPSPRWVVSAQVLPVLASGSRFRASHYQSGSHPTAI